MWYKSTKSKAVFVNLGLILNPNFLNFTYLSSWFIEMESYLKRCTQAEQMKIGKAHRKDAKKITDLTIRSKNYWNYGEKQIAEWKDELTITSKYIAENQVYKMTTSDGLIGFYAFQAESNKIVKLNFLFVAPEHIGNGYGKILINDFVKRIEKTDFKKVTLDADPNAEKFYEKVGFKVVGKLKSSIKNRFLPIMEMEIKPA